MKQKADAAALAARLTAGATTPLQTVAVVPPVAPAAPKTPPGTGEKGTEAKRVGKGKGKSKDVFLRVPEEMHAKLDAIAVERTKATGRGVTVQTIILEILETGV